MRVLPSEVRELPLPNPEKFLTRQEVADELRVALSTVDEWRKQGMPSEKWSKRVRRFHLSKCLAWLRERERMTA